MTLQALLTPNSVAVIGASDDATRIGGRPISYMLSQGFSGTIFPVNPNRSLIQGIKAFNSIESLPIAPDIAIVAVAAASVPQTIAELAGRGTQAAIIFSAGFAELGGDGLALQQAMLRASFSSTGHRLRILGPNALGVVNPRNGFFGSFVSSVELGMPSAGRVAIVSQSGAYGGHLLAAATKIGIGLSACIMTGNEADISLGEVIQIMVDDPDTDVIALYSEGIREAPGLITALEAARQSRKPVVMMKVGRSAVGSQAAQSHTASMAGNDKVIDAVLKELGVVRATSTEHLLDIARLATRRIYPINNALGVITVSGGAGVIISDAADDAKLPVPEMPQAAQLKLKALLPFASPRNPVDVTAQFLNDMSLVTEFTEVLVSEGGYPSILAFFTYTGGAPSVAPQLRARLNAVRQRYPERLFVLVVQASAEQIQGYESDGFCVFEDPTRAVNAIAAMGQFGEAFARKKVGLGFELPAIKWPANNASTQLTEAQAKIILAQSGIASAPEKVATSAEMAVQAANAISYPVVLKIVSAEIIHKSEIGGVLLNIDTEAQVRNGFETLIERSTKAYPNAHVEGVLVAKQLQGGLECFLGIQCDPVFGPIAVFGLGGIFVEIMQDVVLHRCPFDEEVASQMILSIKGAPLLQGARGTPPVDIAALATMLAKLSQFAIAAGPGLAAIDLNPVLALPMGQGAYALDAVIEMKKDHQWI